MDEWQPNRALEPEFEVSFFHKKKCIKFLKNKAKNVWKSEGIPKKTCASSFVGSTKVLEQILGLPTFGTAYGIKSVASFHWNVANDRA